MPTPPAVRPSELQKQADHESRITALERALRRLRSIFPIPSTGSEGDVMQISDGDAVWGEIDGGSP